MHPTPQVRQRHNALALACHTTCLTSFAPPHHNPARRQRYQHPARLQASSPEPNRHCAAAATTPRCGARPAAGSLRAVNSTRRFVENGRQAVGVGPAHSTSLCTRRSLDPVRAGAPPPSSCGLAPPTLAPEPARLIDPAASAPTPCVPPRPFTPTATRPKSHRPKSHRPKSHRPKVQSVTRQPQRAREDLKV